VEWFNTASVSPPLAAAVVHSWLTLIHPFEDGNGRVARLLANLILLRESWPPLIIRASDRLQYLDALSHSDEAGDILPLFDLFVKSIKRGLRELEKPDLARRLFEADLRKQPEVRYELWCQLLTEFVNELRIRIVDPDFEILRFGKPPESTFLLLEERDSAGNMWFAKVRIHGRTEFLMWLGRASNEMYDATSRGSIVPSLFISERDERIDAPRQFRNIGENARLRIDELSITPTMSDDPVDVRYGLNVFRATLVEAAEMLAPGSPFNRSSAGRRLSKVGPMGDDPGLVGAPLSAAV
jgi:hypothetical protein